MQNLSRMCMFSKGVQALRRVQSCSIVKLTSTRTQESSGKEFGFSTTKQTAGFAGQMRSLHTSQALHHQQNTDTVHSVTLSPEKKLVVVSLNDNTNLEFPWVWLRDNCQCKQCFRPELHSRTVDWRTFDVNAEPSSISTDGISVTVGWTDGHQSEFSAPWLLERSFTSEAQSHFLDQTYRLPKVAWSSADFNTILHKFPFKDVLHSDSCLLEYLESLAIYGVTILENAPLSRDQLHKLSDRVTFIKRTHYGTEFEVIAKAGATNLAYQATLLQFHTDLPYYEYKPGINTLHCLVQVKGSGGTSHLTDCLHISNLLRKTQPEMYRILSTTLVDWCDIGHEDGVRFHSLYRSPILCEDHEGRFCRVNYSQQQRDSHFSVPLQQVEQWYTAHKAFTNAIYHPDNMVSFKLNPGDVMSFDNVRLVHGRGSYEDEAGKERHLMGAYWDWDFVYSKMRILRQDLI